MGAKRTVLIVPRGEPPLRRRVNWTKTMREIVLDHLAMTANVATAAESVGLEEIDVCALRRRDAEFAAAFTEAFALGMETLQMRLLALALADTEPGGTAAENGKRIEGALKLLAAHREGRKARTAGVPSVPQFAKPEDTDKVILDQLDVIERRRARERPPPPDRTSIEGEGPDERIGNIHRRAARPAGRDDPGRADAGGTEDDPDDARGICGALGAMGA